MSIIMLKSEFNEDLLACRACLATDRKLHSLQQPELLNAFKNLIGNEITPYDDLPQHICMYCKTFLLKYNKFKEDCCKAILYLEDVRIRNRNMTIDYLNNYKPHNQYKNSEIKQINITENGFSDETSTKTFKIDDIDHCDDETHHQDTLSPSDTKTDIKIYTDTVKIEIETDETENFVNRKNITSKKTKKDCNNKRKGKYFETKDNLSDFEKAFDVEVVVLSREQQYKDVLDRKCSMNYLHSPYKCDLCYKGYMATDLLEKHILSQHDPSRGAILCEFCQFRYKDLRGLNQHLKSHRLKFICKQCSYVSRTTFNAKEHYKMHGGLTHKCRHCGKTYEKLSSHLSHLRLQHPSEFIWCDICGEAFIGAFGLNAHKKRAHRNLSLPVACASCNKHFIDATALNNHSSINRCSDYTCVHCGETFTRALELREHLLETHRSCAIFRCEKCDKTFSREALYSVHYRRIHVNTDDRNSRKKEKPWICEFCGKTLPNKCMLIYHQRNHTGEKPYHCTECPKKFTMRKLLQSHLKVHSSDRPYSCKLCPKNFKGLSALRAHEHIHSGDQKKVSSRNRIIQ